MCCVLNFGTRLIVSAKVLNQSEFPFNFQIINCFILQMIKKFVIDCDAGLDDASALLMAAKAHKVGAIQLIGITTVHGNTSL